MIKKYFTLLELLIVVGIIGILLTLLMPSLSKTKEAARIAVCLSNQSQFYKASLSYTTDNNRVFAPVRQNAVAFMYDNNSTDVRAYDNFILSYKLMELLDCPSSDRRVRYGDEYFGGYIWSNYNFFTGLNNWNNNNGSFTPESPKRVDTSENYWMLIVDRSYKDNWDSDDDWRNHSTWKKGGNQTAMDGSSKFHMNSTMKFFHSHWTGRRHYYWFQESNVNARQWIE